MPTLRIAFACTLTACILFSCLVKTGKKNNEAAKTVSISLDTVKPLPPDPLDMDEYSTGYMNEGSQEFTASAEKISVINGEKGLRVTIDPSALELENGGEVRGRIDVSIIELTSSEDLFKSNAATICDGRLLASGGSYFIGMQNRGQKVRIKKGRTIQVDFPVISKHEMELFYGERDSIGDMNWKRAGVDLVPKQEGSGLISVNRREFDFPEEPRYVSAKLKLYRSLNEKVYYYNKAMKLQELVDTLNRFSKKVFLDTVYTWPRELDTLPREKWDTAFLNRKYGPPKQYFLRTYKSLQDEKDRLLRLAAWRDSVRAEWQLRSLSVQIQKYYQPSAISSLGWINIDRFYRYNERTDVELELPVTLNNNRIQFFLIFKNFNGLMNFYVDSPGVKRNVFQGLPVGEPVTIIGFSKSNGQVLHCKEDVMIRKNSPVALTFKNVSQQELIKIFGKQVGI